MEHDLLDADNLQLRFDHENDSDDMLEGQDQLELAQHQHGQPFRTVAEATKDRLDQISDQETEDV